MNRIILFLLIHLSAIAQPVYCPAKIICEHDSNLASCTFEQHPQYYWEKITGHQNLAGEYQNTYVSAPYYSYDQGYALCIYTHEHTYKTLTLHAKPESNLEMLIQDHELWHFEEAWWECAPKHAQACPLQEQAALMIRNKTQDRILLSNGKIILPGKFMRLYQNDFPLGWIDIFNESNFIGRIVVDLNGALPITHIIEGNTGLYELIEIEGFNAVEVWT